MPDYIGIRHRELAHEWLYDNIRRYGDSRDRVNLFTRCMPYVNVPNDLSKIKTKIAFNLTKRQLVCFGGAALVGVPSYLLARSSFGNTAALFLMLGIMLPAFLLAMYEKDGLPLEKVVKNIIRAKYLRPGVRPYKTGNIYAPFTGQARR